MQNPDERESKIKGVRIRSLNTVMLVFSLLLFGMVLWTTVRVSREYSHSVAATENYIRLEHLAHRIHVASDFLTSESRLYTQSLNLENALNYVGELTGARTREHALAAVNNEKLNAKYLGFLERALSFSDDLAGTELYAMRLVAESQHENIAALPKPLREVKLDPADAALDDAQKLARGREMLFDVKYISEKNKIMDSLDRFLEQTIAETRLEQRAATIELGSVISQQRVMLGALCVLNVLTFAMIILLIVRPLKIYLRSIRNGETFQFVGAWEFKNLALAYNDIFTLKEHQASMLRHKAEHDPLTNLLNRSCFESLQETLAQDPRPIGLVLVDVDCFKEINDTRGHETGDLALRKVAELLRQAFRADDFCLRLGGDEFAVITKDQQPGMREVIMKKINDINARLKNPDDGLPPFSLSVGVAFSERGFSAELYRQADIALYRVKEAGRCGCAFYQPGMGKN